MQVHVEFDIDTNVEVEGELTVLARGTVKADGALRVGHMEVVQGEGALGHTAEELSGTRRESEASA